MKKLFLLFICALLTFTVAACGGDGHADDTDVNTDAPETEAKTAEGYICRFDDGTAVKLGAKESDVLPALGEHSDYMEAPSCIHEGFDRVYTYAGAYTVMTSPNANGENYVAEVSLISDAKAMDVGGNQLYIGCSEAMLQAALGEPAEDNFGVRKYHLDGADVTVTVDNGAVTAVTFTYPV